MKPARRLGDFVSDAELEALARPPAEALGLPGRAYVDTQFFELEREALFARHWLAVATGSAVAAGAALPVDVAGWPLLLVRDHDGVLRVFHNICRHRGMAVVPEPCRELRTLRCPWHGWTYGLDGRLKGTPEFAGAGAHVVPALDNAGHGLLAVRSAEALGLVFVDLGGEAPSLETHLAGFRARFSGWDFDAFEAVASWEHVYECNWKIAVEGAIEDYHLCWVHPQITRGAKRADQCLVETDGHTWSAVGGRSAGMQPDRRGATADTPLPTLAGLPDEEARTVWFANLFPTGVIGFDRSHLYRGAWLPDGPNRTRLRFEIGFVGEAGAREPRFAASRQRYLDAVRDVFAQDEPLVAAVQRNAALRDGLGIHTRFSPFWEHAVHAFQQRVVDCLRDNDAGGRSAP